MIRASPVRTRPAVRPACEAAGLPPPADLDAAPLALVQRKPGQGRLGRWLVWLLIAFSVASVIQAMR